MVTECLDSSICLDGKSDLSCGVVNCNMILALECGTIIRYSFLWSLYNSMWLALSICPCTTFMQGTLQFFVSHLNPINQSCLIPEILVFVNL